MLAFLTSFFSRSSAGRVRREQPDIIQFLMNNAKPKGCPGCFVYHTPNSKNCKKKKSKTYTKPTTHTIKSATIATEPVSIVTKSATIAPKPGTDCEGCREEKVHFCQDEEDKSVKLPYSRGGAGGDMDLGEEERLAQQQELSDLMLATAVSMAASLGVGLKPGVSTRGRGDCLIEACLDQFIRPQFENLTEEEKEPQFWRSKVTELVENNNKAYNMFKMIQTKSGITKKQQWTQDWAKLRQPGQFQCQAGDLMPPGLALALHKNILVFHTHPDAAAPITVHLASQLGGSTTTDIPILLCYSDHHYEGVLPTSQQSQQMTVELVQQLFPQQREAPDVICPVPGKRQRLEEPPASSSSHLPLQLTNMGENLCFTNSVVRLLQQTELKDFLLSELSDQANPNVNTAQELARIYRGRGECSAARLRRYA